jgi:serine/threonine protein kinase
MRMNCPHCRNSIEVLQEESFKEFTCPNCGNTFSLLGYRLTDTQNREPKPPAQGFDRAPGKIGRYEVRRELGRGTYGAVYEAWDPQLARLVAVKIQRIVDAESFLEEGRRLAQLDHPHIVPVYDVGCDSEFGSYFVSKLIQGRNLQEARLSTGPSFHDAAQIVAKLAAALHHAHQRGVIHRDIKPTNILIDGHREPYLTDFGLAISETQRSGVAKLVGSCAYMSPEQASRNADLVDGRSDIFSLGIVFYELLTGVLPFQGRTLDEVLDRIRSVPPIPPRQRNDRIPKAFEEICMRCLATKSSDRYSTASDLADALLNSLTYQPRPIDVTKVKLPPNFDALVERLAMNTHDIWAQMRISEGWQFGHTRDDRLKVHPCLIPYEILPEAEKEYDRAMLTNALSALLALGFEIRSVD